MVDTGAEAAAAQKRDRLLDRDGVARKSGVGGLHDDMVRHSVHHRALHGDPAVIRFRQNEKSRDGIDEAGSRDDAHGIVHGRQGVKPVGVCGGQLEPGRTIERAIG